LFSSSQPFVGTSLAAATSSFTATLEFTQALLVLFKRRHIMGTALFYVLLSCLCLSTRFSNTLCSLHQASLPARSRGRMAKCKRSLDGKFSHSAQTGNF
jgi:hypothetical protein